MSAAVAPEPTRAPTATRLEVVPEPGPIRPRRTVDDLLAEARSDLVRLTAAETLVALDRGAVLVDIRPEAQRAAEASFSLALPIERNVLEWRFDPASDARLPIAGYDLEVIVLCQQGYTSSLAAAALQQLGVWRATDVIGGWEALRSL